MLLAKTIGALDAMIAEGPQPPRRWIDLGLEVFVAHRTFVGQGAHLGRGWRRAGWPAPCREPGRKPRAGTSATRRAMPSLNWLALTAPPIGTAAAQSRQFDARRAA